MQSEDVHLLFWTELINLKKTNPCLGVDHQYVLDHISGGGHLQYMFSHHAEFDNKNYTVLH
jgi:hypothetical protein